MTEPDDMRMAQLEGHLQHWDNEVREARYALQLAELNRERARHALETYEEESQ